MQIGNLFQNLIQIGFGVLYLVGAIFNFLYTLNHGNEFYGNFADKAISAHAKHFVRKVIIPHARLLTIALIVFQVIVAFCLLSRGALVNRGF